MWWESITVPTLVMSRPGGVGGGGGEEFGGRLRCSILEGLDSREVEGVVRARPGWWWVGYREDERGGGI